MGKMRVLKVEPMKLPEVVEIGSDLKSMQDAVGGYIDIVPIAQNVAILLNDEGKVIGLPGNRRIYDGDHNVVDIIAGTFYVCGDDGDSLTDLPEDKFAIYYNYFRDYTKISDEEVQSHIKMEFVECDDIEEFMEKMGWLK